MRDDDGPAEVAAVDVGGEEAGERLRERGQLGGADEVEDEEGGEDEEQGEGDEGRVGGDGGQEHRDHHAVEDLPAGVDLDDGGEPQDGRHAEGDDGQPVGAEEEAAIRGAEDGGAQVLAEG